MAKQKIDHYSLDKYCEVCLEPIMDEGQDECYVCKKITRIITPTPAICTGFKK